MVFQGLFLVPPINSQTCRCSGLLYKAVLYLYIYILCSHKLQITSPLLIIPGTMCHPHSCNTVLFKEQGPQKRKSTHSAETEYIFNYFQVQLIQFMEWNPEYIYIKRKGCKRRNGVNALRYRKSAFRTSLKESDHGEIRLCVPIYPFHDKMTENHQKQATYKGIQVIPASVFSSEMLTIRKKKKWIHQEPAGCYVTVLYPAQVVQRKTICISQVARGRALKTSEWKSRERVLETQQMGQSHTVWRPQDLGSLCWGCLFPPASWDAQLCTAMMLAEWEAPDQKGAISVL